MIVCFEPGRADDAWPAVRRRARDHGLEAERLRIGDEHVAIVKGGPRGVDPTPFAGLPGVERCIPVTRPYVRARRGTGDRTRVTVGGGAIGDGRLCLIAGPCAVEDPIELEDLAARLKAAGADMLRGGAFKPRSSPYSFQGVGARGLETLARAGGATGLPIVTEIVDGESLAAARDVAAMLQVGARNMQNYALLKKVARAGRPVLLKRGMSATLEEWLLSAEYILHEGNPDVVLCERGIRTFSSHSRYTFDLSVVPAAREATHLPILADPSHATGSRTRVPPMARAAVAAGVDGVMVEVHPDPARALSDGRQALLPEEFEELAAELRALAAVVGTATPEGAVP